MGNPDLPTPEGTSSTSWSRPCGEPRTHRYSASQGHSGPAPAQAAYYARRFGVKLNPDTQVVATLGSKEGFANMAQAITAPGDVVLVPEPELSDPCLRLPDGRRRHPLGAVGADAGFFHALERAVVHSIPKPLALVLCYPSNPTAMSPLDFYKRRRRLREASTSIFVLSDLAYSEIYFDGDPPPSVLQVPGAIDVAVEFTSMSKTFSMAGWRMGFAVGNERLIAALARVKSYLDYGAFTPIQVAATAALNGRGRLHRRDARDLSTAAATCWSRASARPAGTVPGAGAPRCSPGCRSPRSSAISAASNSRSS
jgi:alanine-synthesizing transaminase